MREWVNEQTGYAEIVRLASGRSLRLKLRLYNVEGAGRNARNEATARASWGKRISGEGSRAVEAELGPIMLLAVHFCRVDGIVLPRRSGDHGE